MTYLPGARDVTNFALTAKQINHCYTRSIIVSRFAQSFDPLEIPTLEEESQSEYRDRMVVMLYNAYIWRQALHTGWLPWLQVVLPYSVGGSHCSLRGSSELRRVVDGLVGHTQGRVMS